MAERTSAPKIRCAIYTRKSTEEGLEQEFNSLDAQREACAAYIVSQRHEGWVAVREDYDDGGFSGGNMERPAMRRLLADIEAGKVDVIVVYKVDRLTRSLADFAKIVDVLDAKKASFVSITQSFNTTTSIGRLTLNVLLSFAQFEREVTGERIRDKIAASKRKGLWMGGAVPLGYVVKDRRLLVEEAEAEAVRHILQRYLALGSVRELIEELERDGWRTKLQLRASGPHRGGIPFRRGALLHLLSNRIYLGEIVHKGVAYPGEHQPIVNRTLWDAVQAKLGRKDGARSRTNLRHHSLLAGLLTDGEGRPMSPSHAVKGSRRYRYYVTHADHLTADGPAAWRVPAHDLEAIVVGRIAEWLDDPRQVHAMCADQQVEASQLQRAISAAGKIALMLRSGSSAERTQLVTALVEQVNLQLDQITIALGTSALLARLGLAASSVAKPLVHLASAAVRVRRGHEVRLVIPGAGQPQVPAPVCDEKLVSLLAEAQTARALVLAHPDRSINRIAADAKRCRTRLARLMSLSHLAPDIVLAILKGTQPATLSHRQLRDLDLPIDWRAQRILLGFA